MPSHPLSSSSEPPSSEERLDMRGSQYRYHLSTLPPVLGPTVVGRFFSRIGIKILGGL